MGCCRFEAVEREATAASGDSSDRERELDSGSVSVSDHSMVATSSCAFSATACK